MSEPLAPIDALRNLRWKISALLDTLTDPGSTRQAVAHLAQEGIRREIDWILANLEEAGEGNKNMEVKLKY